MKETKASPRYSDLGKYVSPRQVSDSLGISYTSAWRICKDLPHVTARGRVRVLREDYLAALRDGKI